MSCDHNHMGEPPKCRTGELVPPSNAIRFLNPNCKNPSSTAWLGKNIALPLSLHCSCVGSDVGSDMEERLLEPVLLGEGLLCFCEPAIDGGIA